MCSQMINETNVKMEGLAWSAWNRALITAATLNQKNGKDLAFAFLTFFKFYVLCGDVIITSRDDLVKRGSNSE